MSKYIALPLLALLLFGCTTQNQEQSLPDQEANDKIVQVENTNEHNEHKVSNTQIANHLANVADTVPEVNQSTAIVVGPYAVVGLNVDEKLDRSRVGSIKYSVQEALRKDPYGKTAVVVADGDIAERISDMNHSIQQGYPVQGIIEELAAIVGRYMPTFPVPEQRPAEQDQNKEQMPENDKEQLEDIQDEQSNEETDQ